VLIIIGVFMLLGVTLLVLSAVRNHVWNRRVQEYIAPVERRYIHPDPDWDKNIFEDSIYMGLDRSIKYNDGGVVITVIDENDRELYPPAAQFIYDAVHIIMQGDYKAYNNLFADEYWDNGGRDFMFPMQALYRTEIQIINMTDTLAEVKLSYMIYKNDGMFRPDLPYEEEAISPVVYRLILDEKGEIKIANKSPYQFFAGSNFE